jgi:hypothetical protein
LYQIYRRTSVSQQFKTKEPRSSNPSIFKPIVLFPVRRLINKRRYQNVDGSRFNIDNNLTSLVRDKQNYSQQVAVLMKQQSLILSKPNRSTWRRAAGIWALSVWYGAEKCKVRKRADNYVGLFDCMPIFHLKYGDQTNLNDADDAFGSGDNENG